MSALGGKLTLALTQLELDLLLSLCTNVGEQPLNVGQEPLHWFREVFRTVDFNSEGWPKGIDAAAAQTVIQRIQIVTMPSGCTKLWQKRRIEILR